MLDLRLLGRLALSLWNQSVSPFWHICSFTNQESPQSTGVQSFYWGFIRQAWRLIGHVISWSPVLLLSLAEVHWEPQPSKSMISGVASPILSHIVSITQVWTEGLINKGISNYLGKLQLFRVCPRHQGQMLVKFFICNRCASEAPHPFFSLNCQHSVYLSYHEPSYPIMIRMSI